MQRLTKLAVGTLMVVAGGAAAAVPATARPAGAGPADDGPLCPGYAVVLAAQEVIGDSPDVAMFVRSWFGCEERYPGG